ncbi:MAG: amidase [Gemmatimonadales bacterium]
MSDLSRRDFLSAATLAGAGAVIGPKVGDHRTPTPSVHPSIRPSAHPLAFELDESTIADLQAGMKSGKYTARRLTELYFGRIGEMDRQGPTLRAMLDHDPDALAIADALDLERTAGKLRGPLHGIPVVIKDNIATGDRMTTTAGSLALEGCIARRDSGVAARLRAAGAVILGKTNLSEWANYRSTRATSGWSSRGGQCRNPYVLDRNPCGSSSGTGSGVSANFAAVGVGTETDGSIVCPSATNGLVGIKPTVGLVSRAGIIPISHSQDTAGPMARTVTDAALLLGALAGPDPRDPATAGAAGHAAADYSVFLRADGLKGARIGVLRGSFVGYHPEVDKLYQDALDVMTRAGAQLIDPVALPHSGEYDAAEGVVLSYEFKSDLNAYLADLGAAAPRKTLAEIIRFNEEHKDRVMPWFGQEEFLKAEARGPITEKAYRSARGKCVELSRKAGIDAVMAAHRLDALVAPTGNPAWPTDLVNGDHFTGGSSTPAAVAGYPSITVPMGSVTGLPVGLSFIGGAWSEGTMIRVGFAFEQATQARRAPEFLPTLPDTP